MRAHGHKTGLIGTINMKIGDETFEVKNTTPDALTLQQTFAKMVEHGVDSTVMEVSSHALDLGRVHGCDYDVAVFTNLTQDHLDYHKTMEEYKHAKGLLFAQLGNSYNHNREKYAVLNNDDAVTAEYMRSTAATVVTYGIDTTSDVMAKDIVMTSGGTTFTLVTPYESVNVTMKLIGKFNVYNVLAATAAGLVSGVSLETIIDVIKELAGVPGRFEVVDGGQNYTVIVDYAHTPDSLENVLKQQNSLQKVTYIASSVVAVIEIEQKRPIMASVATRYATHAIYTSDNPRSEEPGAILDDMVHGAIGNNYEVIIDRKEAIYHAIANAKAEDIIIIAGKGHETYQIIGKDVHHFDDREIAKEAITERLNNEE